MVTSTKSRQAPSNNDLPASSLQAFTTRFIPILRKLVGSLENPWITEGLVHPMQIIWDGVMQGWLHKFSEDNNKIYHLVSGHPSSLPTAVLTLYHIQINSAYKRFTTGTRSLVRLR